MVRTRAKLLAGSSVKTMFSARAKALAKARAKAMARTTIHIKLDRDSRILYSSTCLAYILYTYCSLSL